MGGERGEEAVDVGGGVVVCVRRHDINNGGVEVEQSLVIMGYVASPRCHEIGSKDI